VTWWGEPGEIKIESYLNDQSPSFSALALLVNRVSSQQTSKNIASEITIESDVKPNPINSTFSDEAAQAETCNFYRAIQ